MNRRIFRARLRPLSLGIQLLAGAVGLLAGAVGLLAGLQDLLSPKDRKTYGEELSTPANAACASHSALADRRNCFSIQRTNSELGYVYWVLQGYGEFQCFVLFDTWKEAVDEACLRIADCRAKSLLSLQRAAITA
jgi:hypothetical protein